MLDVRVLDGRIIVLYKHLLKELDRQRRLADSTVTDYDDFVRRHVVDWWLFRHAAGRLCYTNVPSTQEAWQLTPRSRC